MSRVALGVGLAAFLGMAGAGVAFAVGGGTTSTGSGSSNGSSTTPTPPKGTAPAHPGHRFGGPGSLRMGALGMGPGGGRVLYGQYTIEVPASSTSGGTSTPTYKTIEVQVGTASVSANHDSITVTSADKTPFTYAITSSTIVDSQVNGIGSVSNGDTVRIEGLLQNGKLTAMNIVDTTKLGASRQGFGFGRPGGPGGPLGGGAPPAAASAYSSPA